MERLTKHKFVNIVFENQEKTGIHCSNFCNNCSQGTGDCKHLKAMIEKLAAYEDAEEQGLLLKLPCKVGDTVYAYCSEFGIIPYVVDCIVINEHITFQCSSYSGPIGDCPSECLDEIEPDITDFGKTAFLTQAEAEQKLKETKL